MRASVVRIVLAAGLLANAVAVHHPLVLAAGQTVLAAAVLSGRVAPVVLALTALALLPAPVAETRRLLAHVPLACPCQRTSGWHGVWPGVGAAADAGLMGLAVWLARQRTAKPSGATTES